MAEAADLVTLFGNLQTTLGRLQNSVASHGAVQGIKVFDGKREEFRPWIKHVEKNAFLAGIDEIGVKKLAFQTSSGAPSEFIKRNIKETPAQTWGELKTELGKRFGEISTYEVAIAKIKHIRQNEKETVQTYAERIMVEVEDWPSVNETETVFMNKQLINLFVDGLNSDAIKLKIMRQEPKLLRDAIDFAVKEENFKRDVNLRLSRSVGADSHSTGHRNEKKEWDDEEMEIDHLRHKRFPKRDHTINEVHTRNGERLYDRRVCFNCNQPGHIQTTCPRKSKRPVTCWYCNRVGHTQYDCIQWKRKQKN